MSVSSRCVRECEPFTVTGGSATARTLESFPDDGQIGERGRGEGAQTAPLGTRSTPHTGIGVWAAAAFGLFRLCNKHAPREHHSTRLHQRKYGTMAFFASAPKSAALTHSNILGSRPAGQMKEGGGGGGGGGRVKMCYALSSSRDHGEVTKFFVERQYGRLVAASIAIVRGAPHGNQVLRTTQQSRHHASGCAAQSCSGWLSSACLPPYRSGTYSHP